MVSVLFVCLGNICRSPTAEGVFRQLVKTEGLDATIRTDSAGTGAWHIGQPPDGRAQGAARKRGIDIGDLRARQAKSHDFDRFDYMVAMDASNYHDLASICPRDRRDRLHMFLDFAPDIGRREVPDPYYEGGFDAVFDMVEAASRGLLQDIRRRHGL